MDASHKKIISELEVRHQKELEDLMSEREKALAEEAHATAIGELFCKQNRFATPIVICINVV